MIDLTHHERSLNALAGSASGSLAEALGWIVKLDVAGMKLRCTDVGFEPLAYWDAHRSESTWVRTASVYLSTKGRQDAEDLAVEIEISIPWTTDQRTIEVSDDMPGVRLGSHRGLFVGRPLVPVAQLVTRPGLRVVATATGPELTITPDLGKTLRFASKVSGLGCAVERKQMRVLRISGDGHLHGEGEQARRIARHVEAALDRGTPTATVFSPGVWAQIAEALAIDVAAAGSDVLRSIDGFVGSMQQPAYADEVRADAMQLRCYGDVVRRVIASALLSAARDWDAKHQGTELDAARALESFGASAERKIEGQIEALLRGRLGSGALVISDDDRNTLAQVEVRRLVTRFGPGGINPLRAGRSWLRDIGSDQRGRLCPVMSPENENIGLIRSLASEAYVTGETIVAGDLTHEFGDLSVAAGLLPYINHNDPTRSLLGSKNLRQAVPVQGAQPARVRTAMDEVLASEHGVFRSPTTGRIIDLGVGHVKLQGADGRVATYGFGPGAPSVTSVDSAWTTVVAHGDLVRRDDVVAHAPDVRVIDGIGPVLALGSDVLVACTPWHGFNFEDGVVVSDAILERFASRHRVRFGESLNMFRGEWFLADKNVGDELAAGEAIADIFNVAGDSLRVLRSPERGVLTRLSVEEGELQVELAVKRPLAVGDKLTTRFGGKGVVSLVVPEREMPRLPDGRHVEMAINPLSILRRVTPGQLFELHAGLLADLSGQGSITAGRRVDVDRLASDLVAVGAPGGRLALTDPHGEPWGDPMGVVVGWQYILKLDHLAQPKKRARWRGHRARLDAQPSKGTVWIGGQRHGGAQRLGEMEMWALEARNARELIADVHRRSDHGHDSLRTALTHLRVAGIRVEDALSAAPRYRFEADAIDLDPLPQHLINQIVQPKKNRADRALNEDELDEVDPLHAEDHGLPGMLECPCGLTTRNGVVCDTCGLTPTRPASDERLRLRFKVVLAVPVQHPWAKNGDAVPPRLVSVPVLPPAMRRTEFEPLDLAYRRLLVQNDIILSGKFTGDERAKERALRTAVARVLGHPTDGADAGTIAGRLSGKVGLLRRGLRGRNTESSGRVVLAPDPLRDPESIGLPRDLVTQLRVGSWLVDGSSGVVLLNRQPTLHPYNLVALRVEPIDSDVAQVHPLLCKAIAGDFDGDEITFHHPTTPAARREAWRLFRPAAALRTAVNGEPLAKIDLDVALGLSLLGRTAVVQAAELMDRAASAKECLEELRGLFGEGVERATGWSLSGLELSTTARNEPTSRLREAIVASVAGKPQALDQLLDARGSGLGFDGERTVSVTSSFMSGLTNEEYYLTAPVGLRNLSDKKLVTPIAGGLTKALVEMAYDVVIDQADCGSAEAVRSVLTCRSTGICAECYGLEFQSGEPVSIGTRVGLLAAMLIGERSTQKAMKTHGGAGTNAAVGGNIRRLAALFGRGSIEGLGTLESFLGREMESGRQILDVIEPIAERANEYLEGEVARVHLDVLWRRLVMSLSIEGSGSLLARAQRTGDPLVDATARGDVSPMLAAALAGTEPTLSSLRTHVIEARGAGR